MWRVILVLMVALVALVIGQSAERQLTAVQKIQPITTTQLNKAVNVIRQEHGVEPLALSREMAIIAMKKCQDMLKNNYFAHENKDGELVWEAYDYDYYITGENLSRNYLTAQGTVDGWESSPGHLRNITDPRFEEVGYAVCRGDHVRYVVQELRGDG